MTRWKYSAEPLRRRPRARSRPRPRVRSSSGTSSSGSTSSSVPSPVHLGQAPNGLLNENDRGSTSSIDSGWSLGQAIRSEKRRSRSGSSASLSTNSTTRTPPARPERGLDGVGEATLGPGVVALGDEAVDHDVDGVLDLLLELGRLGQRHDLAVDPGPREALALELGEQVDVLALAGPHDRCEHLEPGLLGQLEQPVDDLLRALPGDRLAADRAVRSPGAREQQAEVVVDLGDGADGRARVAVGRLLVDRDGRRQALDEVDVGLVHLAEELARVGGERLDVAALALGEDRVERQRGLAGAGQPGEDDHRVAGQLDRHVPEVVLTGTADDELVVLVAAGGHG